MNLSELQIGQGKVDVEAEITEIEEPRNFKKFGRDIKVTNAIIKDDSGTIKLTLWNDDIDKVKVGDKVKITNGFVLIKNVDLNLQYLKKTGAVTSTANFLKISQTEATNFLKNIQLIF